MKLYHIVATSGDVVAGEGIIGNQNQLPWPKFSEDLKFFKATTDGNTVIMGRKTFESITKPLPNRENIVLSHSSIEVPEGVKVAHSLDEALSSASKEKVFIIGGADLYKQTINMVDGIYLTKVHGSYQGDVLYPPIPSTFIENERKTKELKDKYKIDIVYLENTATSS